MERNKNSQRQTGKPDKSTKTFSKVKKISKNENGANEKSEEKEMQSILAKMRRLKIQEKLLETAAQNCLDDKKKSDIHATNVKRLQEYSELKMSLQTVESLFDKFKINISSPECIKHLEIEEYKRMVKELDEKFLSFKKYLNKELHTLKHTEINLLSELKQVEGELAVANAKMTVKPNANVVPSPVKAIMNRPSAYPEVHQLQELLDSSGGRRGGWGELEHASFLQCRRRCVKRSGYDFWLQNMLELLVEKIPGITWEEALTHEKWYREYTTLNSRQQAAIGRWRDSRDRARQLSSAREVGCSKVNKRDSRKVRSKSAPKDQTNKDVAITERVSQHSQERHDTDEKYEATEIECNTPDRKTNLTPIGEGKTKEVLEECTTKIIESSEELEKKSGCRNYLKPTKLWNLKTQKAELGGRDFRLHIPMANAPKLGISDWRRCLIGEL